MAAFSSQAINWLERVGPSITWRFVCPNIHSPFDSASANQKLEEYATDRNVLSAVCRMEAWMDETILVSITDINTLDFKTDHPNLIELRQEELSAYLKKSGVVDRIEKEIKKFQQACELELKERAKGPPSYM